MVAVYNNLDLNRLKLLNSGTDFIVAHCDVDDFCYLFNQFPSKKIQSKNSLF